MEHIFSSLCVLLKLITCVGALEFNIGGVFHKDWRSSKVENTLSSSTCFYQCYSVCVSYHFNIFEDTAFFGKLQTLLHEPYDVVVVGEAADDMGDRFLNTRLSVRTPPYSPAVSNSSQTTKNKSAPDDPATSGLGPILKTFLSSFVGEIIKTTSVVLHDESTALNVGELLDYMSEQGLGVEVLMYSLPEKQTSGDLKQTLTEIHKRFYTAGIYVLLLGTTDTVLRTLGVVNSFDAQSNRTTNFRHLSHWLVLTDTEQPELFLPVVDKLENVALVDIRTHNRPIFQIQGLMDYLQSSVSKYFDQLSQVNSCVRRIVLKTNLTHLIDNILSPDRDRLTVSALLGVGKTSRFHTVVVDARLEGSQVLDQIFPNKKYKWNGVHLLVSTKPWPGYVRKITHGNQTRYDGMCIELLKSMATALNFTYTIEEVPDGEWGTVVNGSWTGLIRQLQDRVIDLALADISIHESRETVMDFIIPAFKSEVIDILYRVHDDSDISLSRLTTPLKPVVMPIMAGSLCAFTVLYMLVEYADDLLKVRCRPWQIAVLYGRAVWHLTGSILSQGGSENPRSCSGRLLLASWWLFCVIFAAMYSANLTVSFCIQRTVVPFTSLNDMVYDSDYKWGMFNGSINMLIFGTSKNPLYKATYTRMMEFAQSDPSVLNKDMDRQLDKVINEKYAFISSRNSLNVMAQRAPKGVTLTTVGEMLNPSGAALGVPTDSPLLPEFEWVMGNLRETGILQFWIGQFWNQSQPRLNSFELGGDPLPLKKLLNAFCLVSFGVSLAFIVLVCETVVKCLYAKTTVKTKHVGKYCIK